MAEKQEQSKPSIPAWRAELSEKVREIRAKKGDATAATHTSLPLPDAVEPASFSVGSGVATTTVTDRGKIGTVTRTKFSSRPVKEEQTTSEVARVESEAQKRSNSKLVQDALTRVQRATENAKRSGLSRIEPSPTAQATGSLNMDREATARILEPPPLPPVIQPIINKRLAPQDRRITQPLHSSAPRTSIAVVTQPLVEPDPVVMEDVLLEPERVVHHETECIKQLDEDHCLDYLDAEVERVDRKLHELMGEKEGVGFGTHLMINLVDLLVIGLSCSPFLGLIMLIDGRLEDARIQQVATAIVLLISAFYLLLTQLFSNRTFGMMLTRTRLVASSTSEQPTPAMILTRTAGYALSVAVALLGFFWIAVDAQRRSLHDRISGTMIVTDI